MAGNVYENKWQNCGVVKTKRKIRAIYRQNSCGANWGARRWHFCIFSCYIQQTTFIIDGNQILFSYSHPIEIHAHRSLCPMTLCPHAHAHTRTNEPVLFALPLILCNFVIIIRKYHAFSWFIESGSSRRDEEANGIISIDISAAVNCLLVGNCYWQNVERSNYAIFYGSLDRSKWKSNMKYVTVSKLNVKPRKSIFIPERSKFAFHTDDGQNMIAIAGSGMRSNKYTRIRTV